MQRLEIKGGRKISGTIEISGSKNATLPILASTILTNRKIFKAKSSSLRDQNQVLYGILLPLTDFLKIYYQS